MTRALSILLMAAAVLAAAGCGGAKRTIPTGKAESMLAQLDTVSDRFDRGACSDAAQRVRSLESQARRLSSKVDPEVRRNLIAGMVRLETLVVRDCRRPPPKTTTTTTPTVPTTTTPAPTTTTPTTPSTTPTTPHTTPTTTTPPPTTTGGSGGVTAPSGAGLKTTPGNGNGSGHRGVAGGGDEG